MKSAYSKLTILGKELIRTCNLRTSSNNITFERKINNAAVELQRVEIPGKTSSTVAMGMIVNPSVDLVVACGILGNGFSGRLMKHVRDTCGLTYGIGAKGKTRKRHGCVKSSGNVCAEIGGRGNEGEHESH